MPASSRSVLVSGAPGRWQRDLVPAFIGVRLVWAIAQPQIVESTYSLPLELDGGLGRLGARLDCHAAVDYNILMTSLTLRYTELVASPAAAGGAIPSRRSCRQTFRGPQTCSSRPADRRAEVAVSLRAVRALRRILLLRRAQEICGRSDGAGPRSSARLRRCSGVDR